VQRTPIQLLYWAPMEPRWSRVGDKELMVMEKGKNDVVVISRVETSLLKWQPTGGGVELLVTRTDELWDKLSDDYKATVTSEAGRALEEAATGRTWEALRKDVAKEVEVWTKVMIGKDAEVTIAARKEVGEKIEAKLVDEKWWEYLEAEMVGAVDEKEVRRRWVAHEITGAEEMLRDLAARGFLGQENQLPDRTPRHAGRCELPGPLYDVVRSVLEKTGVLIIPQTEGTISLATCNGTHRNKCAHGATTGGGNVITVAGAIDMSWQTWANFDLSESAPEWYVELERLVDWYADWMSKALERAGTAKGAGLEVAREIGCLELMVTFDRKEVWRPAFRLLELGETGRAGRMGIYDWDLVVQEGEQRRVLKVHGEKQPVYSDRGKWRDKMEAEKVVAGTLYGEWGTLLTGTAGGNVRQGAAKVLREWPEELRSRIGAF